jgi:hypothetical protein
MTEPTADTYPVIRAVSLALLAGLVLHAGDVTAGNGIIVDWREVRSGETKCEGFDPYDTAWLLVTLVGPEAALASLPEAIEDAPEVEPSQPEIVAWAPTRGGDGGRNRSIYVGDYEVMVRAHWDNDPEIDAAHAAFTERLAALAYREGR